MSPSPQVAPAGSSTYSSDTMHVGDGTWDTTKDSYLLPNLVGLNFATMRYNGMGNRFHDMPQYRSLIRAHGVIAAIVFLLIVPAAIMVNRFHRGQFRRAIRTHIWLQVLTVLLTTVVFVLPFFAVGPERSLTNPHHGIGLAIYVLVLVQFIGGWWLHRSEKGKQRLYIPIKAMLHHWVGRAIALLGLAQIPLGLTLYGSPKALFILYALAAFALVLIYFVLEHIKERRYNNDNDSRYSYGTGSVVEDRRRSSRTADLLKGGAAGAGIAALAHRLRRNRSQSRDRDREDRPEVIGSRRHSGSFIEDEKYYDEERGGGWKDRLLKIGAVGGAAAATKSFFNRRGRRDQDSDTGDYGPPLGGDVPINQRNDNSRLNQTAPVPPNGQHPLNQPLHHRRSSSSMTYSSYMSASQEGGGGHGVRDAVAGLGAFGLARNIFKKRRERKEQKRLAQNMEAERQDREHNQRLTGDGTPRRHRRHGSVTTSTDLTASTDPFPGRGPLLGNPRPPPAGVYPSLAGPSAPNAPGPSAPPAFPLPQPGGSLPPPPPHNPTPGPSNPFIPSSAPPIPSAAMPAIPPDSQGILHQNYSGSESSASNQRPGRTAGAAALAGGAAGGLASRHGRHDRSRSRHHSASGGESVASPPVSVKVKMHSDGRHVTLRRLPEEEAAASREARKKERNGRRRRGSGSDLSGTEAASGNRFRRTQAQENQPVQQQQPPPPAQTLPVPPPIPESSLSPPNRIPGAGSVGSPGTYDGNTTEASEYAENRRRRRAERAQAKLAREGRSGQHVEFT